MSNVDNIKQEFNELKSELNDLNLLMKEKVVIDNKIVEEESFEEVINDIENLSSDFNNVIRQLINNKK